MSLSPSNAIDIQVTLGWFTFEPLKGPVALFDCIFANIRKPWFIETFWYCRSLRNSFFCNVLQDGSEERHGIISICNGRLLQTSAAEMLELILCLRQLPSLNPSREGGPSFSIKMGKWSLPQGSGPTFQEKSFGREPI